MVGVVNFKKGVGERKKGSVTNDSYLLPTPLIFIKKYSTDPYMSHLAALRILSH